MECLSLNNDNIRVRIDAAPISKRNHIFFLAEGIPDAPVSGNERRFRNSLDLIRMTTEAIQRVTSKPMIIGMRLKSGERVFV
jgi:hypothetical protein